MKEVEDSATKRSAAQDTIMNDLRKEMEDATKEAAEKEKVLKDMAVRLAPATAAAATPTVTGAGVTLAPTVPGNILHSNDIKPEEMHGDMMAAPQLEGLNSDQALAFVQWSLTYMQSTSTVVPPSLPQQQMAPSQGPHEDDGEFLTDMELSGDEAEAEKANSKNEEVVRTTIKIKRSEKKAKTAAKKGANASASSKVTTKAA